MHDFLPRFDYMKRKYQNLLREDYYFDILLQADLSMFVYEDLPESVDPVWLEKYLLISGSAGIVRDGVKYLVAPAPARCGQLDQYGDGTEIAGSTCDGKPVMGTINQTAAIIYNRDTRMPELDNMIDAAGLRDIDLSSSVNVILSRIAPLYNCFNDNTKKQLESILEKLIAGQIAAVTSDNMTNGLLQDAGIQMIDLTHPEKIQYIQYLTQYYDAVMRRHYNRRGLQIRSGTKQAQQSESEIFGFDSIAWVLPLARLDARRKGLEMFNRLFNEHASVRFSEIWQQEYDAYILRTLQDDAAAETAAETLEGGENDAERAETERSIDGDSQQSGAARSGSVV